jgi:hypothetical protein
MAHHDAPGRDLLPHLPQPDEVQVCWSDPDDIRLFSDEGVAAFPADIADEALADYLIATARARQATPAEAPPPASVARHRRQRARRPRE